MRHTTHIMLGTASVPILSKLKKYVVKYETSEFDKYFKTYAFPELGAGRDAVFSLLESVGADDNVFVAGIEEMVEVKPAESYQIPSSNRSDYLKAFFRALYGKSITINCPGDSPILNLCVYVPIYLRQYWDTVREFLSEIDKIPQEYNVDLFLLPYDTAFLFDEDKVEEHFSEYIRTSSDVLDEILESRRSFKSLGNLVMLQNCNSKGSSLDLDENSFVRITGEYAILSVKHYPDLFQPAAQDPERPLHALGVSVLSFDRYYFVQYLLHRAYAYILDRENVTQSEVDVNKVSQLVQSILSENVKFFSDFYDREIKPRLNDGIRHEDIISQISPLVNAEIARLTSDFQAYIDDSELSLPEKKAALAQLLGEDDDLLVGYMFNERQLVVDDCSREVLDLFVGAHNAICGISVDSVSDNATVSDGEKSPGEAEVERLHQYAVLSPTFEPVKPASVMLDDLKSTKVSMRASTNYIRQKTVELEGLAAGKKARENSFKRLTDDGFVFDNHVYKLQGDVEEHDLDEEYVAIESIASSIDLRSHFTSIKNQGEMGACSVFSLVSIFEYILKKNKQQESDLSEQFVYYNARKIHQMTDCDCGSSLYDVVQTMKKEGVCLEKLFPYDPKSVSLAPSDAAYSDALSRVVLKAKTVKRSLKDIKSALCEGYPVAISLKIFDSFEAYDGFVRVPSEDEIENATSGNHAMVICGYDDETRFFVVRNSWGTRFGDRGYCYIPYGYIDNEKLLNGACIITEINNSKLQVKGADRKVVVSFDLMNAGIKSEILTNLINDETFKLKRLTVALNTQVRTFNELFQALGNNSVRSTLSDGTIARLAWECGNLETKKSKLQKERTDKLEDFDRDSKHSRVFFWIGIAIVSLVFVLLCVIRHSFRPLFTKYSLGVYILVALFGALFYLWMRRRKRERKDLDEDYKFQLKQITQDIDARQRESSIVRLKNHIAGMVIDSLYKLSQNLQAKYSAMTSYVGNLKLWREQESDHFEHYTSSPYLSLISDDCLNKYFECNKDKLTDGLNLSEMFRHRYKVEDHEIVKFKNELKNKLIVLLDQALADFSIFKYVTRECEYPYASHEFTNIDNLLREMDGKSTPFVRLNNVASGMAGINTHCKMMFVPVEKEQDRKTWEEACGRNFGSAPQICEDDSKLKMTLLQLKGVSRDEVALFDQS